MGARAPHHAARGPARLSLCPKGLPARLLTGLPPSLLLLRCPYAVEATAIGSRAEAYARQNGIGSRTCRASSVWVTTGGDYGVS